MNDLGKSESPKHRQLVIELMGWMKENGYRIVGVDLEGHQAPSTVDNKDKIGDCENKIPDIEAKDDTNDIFVRGEAKTGDGDLDSFHTETQFKLFSDRINLNNKKSSLLFIIVPSLKIPDLQYAMKKFGLEKPNVIPIKSGIF